MGSKKLHNLYIISLSIAACGETIGGHHNWFGHQQPNEAVAHCRRPHRYCPPAGDSGRHFCHYHSRTKWLCKYRSIHKWCHQFLSLHLPMTSAIFKTNYLFKDFILIVKSTFLIHDWQFTHFHISQHFISDTTLNKNSNLKKGTFKSRII